MDDTTPGERQEWEKLMEKEKNRRKDLEELRKMVESTEKKYSNPKDLIKLLVKAGEIRPEEASSILGVDRSMLDRWCKLLENRGYLEVEGSRTQNEILKPTSRLMDRVRAMKAKSRRRVLEEELEREEQELTERQKELAEERQKRLELEEKLEKANDDVKKKQAEIEEEKRRSMELQGRLFEMERQAGKGHEENCRDVLDELERERRERARVEEELRREKEMLENTRARMGEQKAELAGEQELKTRGKLISQKEEELKNRQETLDQEEEELSLLLGEGGPNLQERIKSVLDAIRSRKTELKRQKPAGGDDNSGR